MCCKQEISPSSRQVEIHDIQDISGVETVKVTWVTLHSLEKERQGTFIVWTHLTSMTLPHGCRQTGLG